MARSPSKPKRKVSAGKQLARPGDPLVMPDGQVVKPYAIDGVGIIAEASKIEVTATTFKPSVRRSIRDMPADGNQLKAICCVVVCTIAGMTDRDIAELAGTDAQVVDRIRKAGAYADIFEILRSQFINANSDMLQARLAAYGAPAVTRLAEIAFTSSEEKNSLKAADSLLDRNEGAARIGPMGKTNGSTLRILIEDAVTNENGVKVTIDGVDGELQ